MGENDQLDYDRPYERHGNKYVVTSPGCYLKYENMQDTKNESGRMLQIRQKDPLTGVCVQTDIQFYDGVPVARFVNHVTNEGEEEQVLTYLSSFTCSGIKRDGNFLYIPHNGWQKELNWRRYSFEELGFPVTQTKSIREDTIVKEELPHVSGDIADFHRNVAAVIRDGAEPEIKLFQVMRVMKLMEAIFQSAETNQVIDYRQYES